ncbi:ABC transporter permease [Candidatus Woesearchaeota archaeon]|nr:ABC transporter permease [Candidatus Woesearchaeota archaeon]
MIKDYFLLPLKEIKHRKLRSFLTLFGIIIGITAVISLITLGQGLQNAIAKQFTTLGTDKLIISAKGNVLNVGLSIDAVKITTDDIKVIQKTPGVKNTAAMIYSSPRVEFNDNPRYFYVMGISTKDEERTLIEEAHSYKLLKGRSLQPTDNSKAVLGYEFLQKELFNKEIELSDTILLADTEFKVVGFYDRTGNPVHDKSLVIPLKRYQELFNKSDEVGMIIAQTQAGENPSLIADKITKELRKSRYLKEGKEDFSIETPEQLASTFSTILDIMQIVLIGIACISLLVGGIGIMNTMYTAVLQRTKEIGVMKALGAQNYQIMSLFLIESGFYGLGGGIIGVILGIFIAKFAEYSLTLYLGPSFLSVEINIFLIIGTLLFSFIIGCISGLAPAIRASKLNPVQSLRYE